jgi:hypothetical protein
LLVVSQVSGALQSPSTLHCTQVGGDEPCTHSAAVQVRSEFTIAMRVGSEQVYVQVSPSKPGASGVTPAQLKSPPPPPIASVGGVGQPTMKAQEGNSRTASFSRSYVAFLDKLLSGLTVL